MSETIRWGIIATGEIAGKMAHDLKTLPDAELVAVGSRTQQNADEFAAEYGIPRAYDSYEAVANDPDVDVVYIATPNDLHVENALTCIEAGKAVLCEKPFAFNAEQAKKVFARAKEKGVFLMEAMWSRFLPTHRKLHELAWTGAFGDIRMIQADFGYRTEYNPEGRLFNLARGGGALMDVGTYTIALAVRLLGKPDRITGYANLTDSGVDEQASVLLGFPSGGMAVLNCATRTKLFDEARIFGTKGRARLHESFWKGDQLTTFIDNQEQHYSMPREDWGYQYQAREVHRCLRAGELESPTMPHEDSLTILGIMDTLREQWGIRYPGE